MERLQTYHEIQGYGDAEVGHVIQYDEMPQYVFVWGEGDKQMNLWVTNNVCELEYSLFQYVLTLESTLEIVTKENIDEVAFNTATWIYEQKQQNALPNQFIFKTESKKND
jgi:hypothetical protein